MSRSKEAILANYREKYGDFEIFSDENDDGVRSTYIETEKFLAKTIYANTYDFQDLSNDLQDLYWRIFRDQRVLEKLNFRWPQERQDFELFIEEESGKVTAGNQFTAFMVTDKERGVAVGFEGIYESSRPGFGEIDYLFIEESHKYEDRRSGACENLGALVWGYGDKLFSQSAIVRQRDVMESDQFIAESRFNKIYASINNVDWESMLILSKLGFRKSGNVDSFKEQKHQYELDYGQFSLEEQVHSLNVVGAGIDQVD